jgi:outer membrane protein assembly factor BamB
VDIFFDTTDLSVRIASARGAFSKASLKVPQNALPGEHWITAIGRNSRIAAQAAFRVRTDWSQPGFSSSHESYNPYENVLDASNVADLEVLWTADLGESGKLRAVANGLVYATTANKLSTFGATNGRPVWSKIFSDSIVSLAAGMGRVYLAINKTTGDSKVATLYALRADNGRPLWEAPLGGEYGNGDNVVLANGVVYTGSTLFGQNPSCKATLSAIRAADGKPLWSQSGPTMLEGPCWGSGPVSAANGVVYARFPCNDRACLSPVAAFKAADGTPLWTTDDAKGVATPVVANGAVYLGGNWAYVGSLTAFSAVDGSRLWNWVPDWPSGVYQPAAAKGALYVSWNEGGPSQLRAFDASNGMPLWSQSGSSGNSFGSPTLANGVVYVGGAELAAFAATDGKPLWNYPLAGSTGVNSEIVVVNGLVYVSSQPGTLHAFDLDARNVPAKRCKERGQSGPDPAKLMPDLSLTLE